MSSNNSNSNPSPGGDKGGGSRKNQAQPAPTSNKVAVLHVGSAAEVAGRAGTGSSGLSGGSGDSSSRQQQQQVTYSSPINALFPTKLPFSTSITDVAQPSSSPKVHNVTSVREYLLQQSVSEGGWSTGAQGDASPHSRMLESSTASLGAFGNSPGTSSAKSPHGAHRQINWAIVPLVTGSLYVKYGTIYVLCDCKIDATMLTIVPRKGKHTARKDLRDPLDVRVDAIVETKLLNVYHYYDNFMFELVVRGSVGRYQRLDRVSNSVSGSSGANAVSHDDEGRNQGSSSSCSPPPGRSTRRSSPTTGTTTGTPSLPSSPDALSVSISEKPLPEPAYEAPHNPSDFLQRDSVVQDAGHPGGEGFTVLTFKSFSLPEMSEWVDAFQEVQAHAQMIFEYSTGDTPLRASYEPPPPKAAAASLGEDTDPLHHQSPLRSPLPPRNVRRRRRASSTPSVPLKERRRRRGLPMPPPLELDRAHRFYSPTEMPQQRLSSLSSPETPTPTDTGEPEGFTGLKSPPRGMAIAPSRKPLALQPHTNIPLRLPVYGQGYYAIEAAASSMSGRPPGATPPPQGSLSSQD